MPNGHTYLCRLAAAKARFDNRHSTSAPDPTLAQRQRQRRKRYKRSPEPTTSPAEPIPRDQHRQICTCLPRAKGSLDRRSKRLSFPHFFLRRKKCGRRRPPPRQGETDSPPGRRNSPNPAEANTPTVAGQAVAEASAPVNAGTVLLTDNDDRCTPPASTHRQICTCPPRAKGFLNRRFEWFSLVTFFLQKKKVTRAGARNSPSRARKRKKRDGLRRLFLYLISCPCGSATPAPAPARISASCSPPPACRSGYPARSTSRTQTWPR